MSVKLRKIREEDLKLIMNWRMSPEVTKYMYSDPIITLESQEEWFNKKVKGNDTEKYWIIQLENGVDVGLLSINDIDFRNKKASWAYYLGSTDARGKGLARILECNIYDYVFQNLDLNKLWCEVFEFNEVVVQIHKKFGAKIEGRFIDHIYKNGDYYNVIRMATLKKDWFKMKNKITYDELNIEL